MSSQYRSFAHRVEIGVSVERVWRAFTDSRMLERWTTPGATVAPREKGRMHVQFGEGVELDAHIDVLATPQRIRLILLPTRGMPDTEAVIVEDFLFERALPTVTVVRLLSSGVPSKQAWVSYYLTKRRYWELALTRLKVFLEKGLDQEQPKPRY
ncbi:MAG TPA: SRPBCC domain-containing protein [Steroidobacteraceae bacterium]|nr:SRPBCC domain-containing protein [Steroidobacteraceae bacterium]